ncbi:quinolinate synthetase complex, A subunit, partial [mine drainage metagenome]
MGLKEEIAQLKRERDAVILAHNYQVGEIQDLADYVGDSLYLSRQAAGTSAQVLVFSGVRFMAETAKILSPEKTVLLPDREAGCSLADSITADELRAWKAQFPHAVVVSYVNTSAEVKAESDYCCTSSNAVKIVERIPSDREILFLPDMFLGEYVRKRTGRKNLHLWVGDCFVHTRMRPETIARARAAHPGA